MPPRAVAAKEGLRKKQFTLRRGGAQSRERVRVDLSDGKPRTVKVRLRLLGADGKPWLIVERQLQVNQPQGVDPGVERVPVVHTLSDGTRIVEYLSRKDALARGFPAAGKPAPSAPQPPPDDNQEKQGAVSSRIMKTSTLHERAQGRGALGCLFALLAICSARADWIATGQFNYTDRLHELPAFTGTLVRPVREADVQVYDTDTLMWLIDPNLSAVLAYNDDPYDAVLNTQSSGTAQDMSETVPVILWQAPSGGVHYVYVRHASHERNLLGRYGTYNIRVRSLATPTPTVTSVSEQRMLQEQFYQVLVVGTNFTRGATVATNNAGVAVSAVNWIAPTALVVTLTPSAAVADGIYSLSVSNPGGATGTLASAFEVNSAAMPPVMITEVNLSSGLVEVKNFGTVPATLTGWQIQSLRPSTTTQTFTFPAFTLAAGATVVVHEGAGTNTSVDLFDLTNSFNWPWVNGTSGDVSLIDDGGRNVDFIRVVSSAATTHSLPQGTGGAWMTPQFQSPASGFTVARSEATALYRTSFGLSRASPTMPASASGRTNNVDPWEDNDLPRRAALSGQIALLSGLKISARPSGTDNDWFGFLVEPGDEVVFNATFTHADGNLDLQLYAPGEETVPLLSATSTSDNETLTLSPAQSTTTGGGLYRLRVFGVSGAVNSYALSAGPVVTIAATDSTASESNVSDTGQFTITRTGSLAAALVVHFADGGPAVNGVDYASIGTSVTIPASASSAPVVVSAVAENLAEGTEGVTLTLIADPAYSVGVLSGATVNIADKPMDAWRFAHFGGNPPGSGDEEDADGDGSFNLLEYGLGMNPNVPGVNGLPVAGTETELGTNYLTLTYLKDTSKSDIIYQAQSSLDSADWTNLSDMLVGPPGGIETREARVAIDAINKFVRLKITRP